MAQGYAQYGGYDQAVYPPAGYGQQYAAEPQGYAQQDLYPAPQLFTEAYPEAAMPVEYVIQQPVMQPAMVPYYQDLAPPAPVIPMSPQREMVPQPLPMPVQMSATAQPKQYLENGGKGKILRQPTYGCCGLVQEQPAYYEADRDRDNARRGVGQVAAPAPPPAPPRPTGSYFEEGSSGEAL